MLEQEDNQIHNEPVASETETSQQTLNSILRSGSPVELEYQLPGGKGTVRTSLSAEMLQKLAGESRISGVPMRRSTSGGYRSGDGSSGPAGAGAGEGDVDIKFLSGDRSLQTPDRSGWSQTDRRIEPDVADTLARLNKRLT